jgi:hypothetical protein
MLIQMRCFDGPTSEGPYINIFSHSVVPHQCVYLEGNEINIDVGDVNKNGQECLKLIEPFQTTSAFYQHSPNSWV